MTVEVDRDALLGAVRRVIDVTSPRETLAILRNVLLRAVDGQMTVTGNNLDLQVSAFVNATGELATTVDAGKLLAAVDGVASGVITITPVDGRAAVTLRRGRSVRTLATLPAVDFPTRPALDGGARFAIAAPLLSRVLDTTSIAHGNDYRAFLAGTYLHPHGEHLRGVATDGFKVVRCDVPAPEASSAMPGIILPTKAVALIRKLLVRLDVAVQFAATVQSFELETEAFRIRGQLIDGTYPDYERIIPAEGAHAMVAARDALLAPAASVAAVVNAEGERKVRPVAFTLGSGDPVVSAQDAAGTDASEPVDCDYTGSGIRFGVDSRYLAVVGGIFAESGRLTISINDPSKPMRLTGDQDPDLVAVIGSWAV